MARLLQQLHSSSSQLKARHIGLSALFQAAPRPRVDMSQQLAAHCVTLPLHLFCLKLLTLGVGVAEAEP